LSTTNKVYDSQIGNTTTTNNYGANPELGLLTSAAADPTGLNYSSSSTYESPGAGSFLRQTGKTLPGGTNTTYSYYAATDTADNPCTAGTTEAYKQAGLSKLKTEQDPDGGGTLAGRKSEVIYDDAGRVVATRMIGATNQTDPWSCTTYDARGRVSQTVTPTISGRPGRTINYDYAVSDNPLTGSSTDSITGTSSVTVDLLGRTTATTDVFGYTTTTQYDTLGRVSQTTSLKGTEVPTYNNLNQVTGYAVDSTTYATMTYDNSGRLATVNYPQATNGTNTLRLTQINRDTLQRTTGSVFTFADNTTITETVGLSVQKGLVTSDTITKGAQSAGASYQYDTLGRLTGATIDNWQYQYGFSTQQAACTSIPGFNANAHKNGNRTSTSITNTLNSQNTTTPSKTSMVTLPSRSPPPAYPAPVSCSTIPSGKSSRVTPLVPARPPSPMHQTTAWAGQRAPPVSPKVCLVSPSLRWAPESTYPPLAALPVSIRLKAVPTMPIAM
jgi:YD repeat-containing protein